MRTCLCLHQDGSIGAQELYAVLHSILGDSYTVSPSKCLLWLMGSRDMPCQYVLSVVH